MIWADPLPADVHQLPEKVSLLSKVVLPALATLVPAAVSATVKWAGDHSRKRRSSELTTRISELAKSISELPEVSLSGAHPDVSPRSALTAELEAAVLELTALQIRVSRHTPGISTVTTKVRAALLLYTPKGFGAWTLHIAFYLYSFLLIFVLFAVVSDNSTPVISTSSASSFFSDLLAFIFVFGLAGIPPLIMRYYAAKIHRAQCAQAQPQVPSSVATAPALGQRI